MRQEVAIAALAPWTLVRLRRLEEARAAAGQDRLSAQAVANPATNLRHQAALNACTEIARPAAA
jgi:hypothetical protein